MSNLRPKSGPTLANGRGFTMIELMVAMTVLALLLTILLSMVNGASSLWRESERRVDSFREARAAMNLITSDLESIFASTDSTFIAIATENDEISELANTAADSSVGHALFFVTATPDAAQDPDFSKSDLCAVGYFVSFGKASASIDAKSSYNLYRYFISSDQVFNNITTNKPSPFFGSGGAAPDAPSIANSAINEVEIVARNITKFQIQAYTLIADASGRFSELTEFDPDDANTPVPDVLDLTLVAVNQDIADRWDGKRNDWEDETSKTYEQNARTFTARVYLTGARVANANAASSSLSPSPTP